MSIHVLGLIVLAIPLALAISHCFAAANSEAQPRDKASEVRRSADIETHSDVDHSDGSHLYKSHFRGWKSPRRDKLLSDPGLTATGWRLQDGWQGLVPGRSGLPDVVKVLGEPMSKNAGEFATTYLFDQGKLEIEIPNDQTALRSVKISRDCKKLQGFPEGLSDAQKEFGKLVRTQVLPHGGGDVYERPGMAVSVRPNSPNKELIWLLIHDGSQAVP